LASALACDPIIPLLQKLSPTCTKEKRNKDLFVRAKVLGIVVHACNPSPGEAEAGGS
jgi:hypothetical protein